MILKYYIEEGDDILPIQKEILNGHGITQSTKNCHEAHIVILRNYTFGDQVIDNKLEKGPKYCSAIKGMDELCGKGYMFNNLLRVYGFRKCCTFLPKTFTLDAFAKLTQQSTESKSGKRFILKKDLQRQEGLKILTAKEFASKSVSTWKGEKWVVIQEFMMDPLLIKGRKTNLRIYVLVIKPKDYEPKVYCYQNGFMYYTPLLYYKNSLNNHRLITSGYVDRYVYKTNPLTHDDLKMYLGKDDSHKLFDKAYKNIALTFKGLLPCLKNDKFDICFQLFGVDVQPNHDISNVHVLEINKNPDLNPKDETDKALKTNLQKDIFNLVLNNELGNFIQII